MKKSLTLLTIVILLTSCSLQTERHKVHYHANWALFIEGDRIDFSSDKYMEPVISCDLDESQMEPEQRVHLHNNDQNTIHIHAAGATWNHFLNNLGWNIGSNYLVTDTGNILKADETHHLTFIINGKKVNDIQNLRIENEEKLLISYGSESFGTVLENQYSQVNQDAHEHNEKDDPSTCSAD